MARPIVQKPLSVGPIEWLPRESVGEEVVALLPRRRVVLNADTEGAVMRAFGDGGVRGTLQLGVQDAAAGQY